MLRRPWFKPASTVAAILILAAGCADTSPTAIQLEPTLAAGANAAAGTARVVKFDHEAGTYSAQIGPHGGTLDFGIGSIEFPAGALRNNLRITAVTDGVNVSATMGPSGLQFPAGATLCFNLAAAGESEEWTIMLVNEAGKVLEAVPGAWISGRFCGMIRHFSAYAVGSPN